MIQNKACRGNFPLDEHCRDCRGQVETVNDDATCRFIHFRTLKFDTSESRNTAFTTSFCDPTHDPTADEKSIWMCNNKQDATSLTNLDTDTCKEILETLAAVVKRILNQEQAIQRLDFFISQSRQKLWKKHISGIRELCDICKTSIFDSHWTCPVCGLAVCPDCFIERLKVEEETESPTKLCMENKDKYGWLGCTSSLSHSCKSLTLTQIIPHDIISNLAEILDDTLQRFNIIQRNYPQPPCQASLESKQATLDYIEEMKVYKTFNPNNCIKAYIQTETARQYPQLQHMWLCYGKLLRLMDPHNSENINLFKDVWRRGQPLMISSMHIKLDQNLWTPQAFEIEYGHEKQQVIDCDTGKDLDIITFKQFWEGFQDTTKQIKNNDGNNMALKIKDWPPNIDFADFSPSRFLDFNKSLPLQDFTLRTGRMNLVARLPQTFRKPDLGPRMYIAFGEGTNKDVGTTKLHLDVSDALNVLVNVCIPLNSDTDSEKEHIIHAIQDSGCDEKTIKEAIDRQSTVGAIWHIYTASDAPKIRQLLRQISSESGEKLNSDDDPIHDQKSYLDKTIRERLARDKNVIGFPIIQCMGDAVFIPAGAPHQVRNLRNCIKIAQDFVSPSSVTECLQLTQEFRRLSDQHTNHEDKLQIKNIIFHTIKDILSVLAYSSEPI